MIDPRTQELADAVAASFGCLPQQVAITWTRTDAGEPYPSISLPPLGFIIAIGMDEVRERLQKIVEERRAGWARVTVRDLDTPSFAMRMRHRRA